MPALPAAAARCRWQVERRIRFVDGEDAGGALDADSDDDVLALTPALDLHELVEDELLLALPLVPRHEVCPSRCRAPQPTRLRRPKQRRHIPSPRWRR